MERLRNWKIDWTSESTGALHRTSARYRPAGRTAVLLAHGAGLGQDAAFMVALRDGLASNGISVMTFNYPYMESGRRAPDRMPTLLAAQRAAFDRLGKEHDHIVLAGKSMGGRMSSHLAAEGFGVGLIVYGYPLVGMGKGDPRNTDHFRAISQPTLFIQGTRDSLAPLDKLRPRAKKIDRSSIHTIADADHSYRVPKRTGRTTADVMDEIVTTSAAWLSRS